jgi:hypothetical protein
MSKILIFFSAILVVFILAIMIFANPFVKNNPIQDNETGNANPRGSEGSSGTGNAIADNGNSDDSAGVAGGMGGAGNGGGLGGGNAENGGDGALFLPDGGANSGRISCSEINLSSCDENSTSVCGWYDPNMVECNIGPCVIGFVNECDACSNKKIEYISHDECPLYG